MDIEQAINIAKGCVMASFMESETKQMVIEALNQVAIPKMETTGCEWCERISKYAGFGYATFFEQMAVDEQYEFSVDVMFCPNCGRKIQED